MSARYSTSTCRHCLGSGCLHCEHRGYFSKRLRRRLNHLGSLITVGDPGPDGKETCLGYLMNFNGRGVYSPDGKAEVSPEDCEAHNKALSQAEIDGLDNNCEVGMRGTFYHTQRPMGTLVTTFTGVVVATDVTVRGQVITFHRNGKTYRGRLQKDAECFNFKRIK